MELSNKVALIRNEVSSALVSVKNTSEENELSFEGDVTHTYASVCESITRNLCNYNTESAVQTLHMFREKLFIEDEQEYVEFLAKLYSRYLVEKKPGALVMSKRDFTLSSMINELKEMTINILSVIEQLSPVDKS